MTRPTTALFLPEDPAVLSALGLNNLAGLYTAQGRYAEAEPLFQRALPIVERALGPEHPYVAATIRDYAQLLRATGCEAEAAETEARAEGIRAGPRLVAHDVKRPPQSVLEACAVEVLMLGDWRAAAGEVGFWPECGHLARPTLGWKSQTGRPEGKRFAFHTRSMGTARPGVWNGVQS